MLRAKVWFEVGEQWLGLVDNVAGYISFIQPVSSSVAVDASPAITVSISKPVQLLCHHRSPMPFSVDFENQYWCQLNAGIRFIASWTHLRIWMNRIRYYPRHWMSSVGKLWEICENTLKNSGKLKKLGKIRLTGEKLGKNVGDPRRRRWHLRYSKTNLVSKPSLELPLIKVYGKWTSDDLFNPSCFSISFPGIQASFPKVFWFVQDFHTWPSSRHISLFP